MEPSAVQVSVVMPCLNEEKTIGICVEKALHALDEMGASGEVIVSDNGSTDCSAEIAQSLGACTVHQSEPGYGSAYLKGLKQARGRYIVIQRRDPAGGNALAPSIHWQSDPIRHS